jgi:hypothetical protein
MAWPNALAATDSDHNFDTVTRVKQGLGMTAPGHNLAIPFDRDAFSGELAALQ